MPTQQDIENYLLKNTDKRKGYLLDPDNNGKVIMLSGAWGSGKTYFWQDKVVPFLNDKENKGRNKIPNHYISLYGKKSIEEVETELFLELYKNFGGIDENMTKVYSNFSFFAKHTTKAFKNFSEVLDKFKEDFEINKAKEFLSKDAVICFDDFERKSKDIDLNDLFGFITQLTINFNCKIVIILNDDVFEGKEKDIFSNVKEKTVSKFLRYKPKIKELFTLIFENHKINDDYPLSKECIQSYIEEIDILNARIYIQVLDSLFEWIKYYPNSTDKERRCLVLSKCLFILYHSTFYHKETSYAVKGFVDEFEENSNIFNNVSGFTGGLDFDSFDEYFIQLQGLSFEKNVDSDEKNKLNIEKVLNNKTLYKSKFFANKLHIADGVNDTVFDKINNFIETGILIKED